MSNPLGAYPRINEAAKDLLTVSLGLGALRLAGLKLEVGQLSIKTLAFGAATLAGGAALGREAHTYKLGADLAEKKDRKNLNSNVYHLATLAVAAVATLAVSQHSRVSSYLPAFTHLCNSKAYALAGFGTASMVAFRYFGFTEGSKLTTKKPLKPDVPFYNPSTDGEFSGKGVLDMLGIQEAVRRKEVQLAPEQQQAWNDQVDVHVGNSEDRAAELDKYTLTI